MGPADFVQRVQHLFPGSADLEDLADTLKMLRDKPAPEAVLIKLRYFQARVTELSEEVIIWRRRVDGKPHIQWSPEMSPPPSHWGPPPVAVALRVDPAPAAACPDSANGVTGISTLKSRHAEANAPAAAAAPVDEEVPPRHRFRAARLRLGLSQAQLADRLGGGMTAALVSQIETARRPCSEHLICAVERLAGERIAA